MLSSLNVRPLAAAFRGGRAKAPATAVMFNVRNISVGAAKSQKHLLSEFKGVRGPQSEEVSDGYFGTDKLRRKGVRAKFLPFT